MKKIILTTMILLLLSTVYAETIKTCIDSDTLQIITNKTITTDGVDEIITVTETVNCPNGCGNGKCKPTNLNMTVPIYIFIAIFGISLMMISFFKSDILIFKWLSVIIFFMLGASSFNINRDFCEYTSSGWSCYVQQYRMVNLAYLWFGLGAIMLVYAFLATIYQPAQNVIDEAKRIR